MNREKRKCPKCGKWYNDYPAISRFDNNTEICPDCGMEEAFFSYFYHERRKADDRIQTK